MVTGPVNDLIKDHKTYFYGVASFYAFFITFGAFLSVTGIAFAVYGVGLHTALWLVLIPSLYIFVQLANGFFLFTVTYISALLLEHKQVTLQDTTFIIQTFFVEILKLPFYVVTKRDALRRYLSYPHAIFSNTSLTSAYEDTEKLKEAIGGTYTMLSLGFIGTTVSFTALTGLSIYLLPLNPYILFSTLALYIFLTSFTWFYFKAPKLIERTALYIYAKAGRIPSPFTFDDLKEAVS